MSMSKEIPVEKYTRNINKKILNTGIFSDFNPIKKLPNLPSSFKKSPDKEAFLQRLRYSFKKMSPLVERANRSYNQNKFYGPFHKKDRLAFGLIVSTLDGITSSLKSYNYYNNKYSDDELALKYSYLETCCISYLNSYCRITFTKEARQRKALAQSILKKCHKLIPYYPNKNTSNLKSFVSTSLSNNDISDSYDDIDDFRSLKHTAEEAALENSESENIFKNYMRNEVIASLGDLTTRTLINIAFELDYDINVFRSLNYTAKEAKLANFESEDIFNTYTRDEIIASYGDLTINSLREIKRALNYDINIFKSLNYTAKEAELAGFKPKDIFNTYTRDEIITSYGDKGNLNKNILKNIKQSLNDNIYKFRSLKYTSKEAKLAGFSKKEIRNQFNPSQNFGEVCK